MKITKIAMIILAIALALYILIPSLSWAEDGTAVHGGRSSPLPAWGCSVASEV